MFTLPVYHQRINVSGGASVKRKIVAVVKIKKAKKKETSEHEDIPDLEARARSASKAKGEPDKDMVPQALNGGVSLRD